MSDPKALVPRLPVSKCCILKKMKFEIEKTVANIFLCHSARHAVLFHMLVLWSHRRICAWEWKLMLDSTVYVEDAGEGSMVANPLAKNVGENRKGRVPVCSVVADEDNEGLEKLIIKYLGTLKETARGWVEANRVKG